MLGGSVAVERRGSFGRVAWTGLPRDAEPVTGRACVVNQAIGGQSTEGLRSGNRLSGFARNKGTFVGGPGQIRTRL